jgi:hypothetical protein
MPFKLKPLEWFAAAALIAVAVFFWHKNYFIQDDAYIAFVYAKNFAQGHGLVWYPGLDEYGYTNFLYTLVVGTVMFWLPGIDPEYISATINFISYLAALTLTYLLTLRLKVNFSPRLRGELEGGDKATLTRLAVARHPLPLAGEGKIAAAGAVLILATHHTFSAYASGGLETMTVTALILGFYYVLFSPLPSDASLSPLPSGERVRACPALVAGVRGKEHALTLAFLASAALLTRLDSALLLLPGYVYLLYRICHPALVAGSHATGMEMPQQVRHDNVIINLVTSRTLWLAAGIPTLCVLALLGWAKLYYGYALPNTFYAKIPGDSSMVWLGQRYILKYLALHHYIPAALLGLSLIILFLKPSPLWGEGWVRGRSHYKTNPSSKNAPLITSPLQGEGSARLPLLTLLSAMFLWLGYVVYVGGCFMEFRLLVPILPMFAVVVFAAISSFHFYRLELCLCFAAIIGLLVANTNHDKISLNPKQRFGFMSYPIIETTHGLDKWLTMEKKNWRIIGKKIHTLLRETTIAPPVIAVGPAGSIPFYSNLRSVDLLGLNTRRVKDDIGKTFHRPGHKHIASSGILFSESVNLNIYHPQFLCPRNGYYQFEFSVVPDFPFKRRRTVLIPINDCYLVADYITYHPHIEALLANGTILDYRANQDKFQCPKWLCMR